MSNPPADRSHSQQTLSRYALAIGIMAVAVLARRALLPEDAASPYLLTYTAAMVVALLFGIGPALAAAAVGIAGTELLVVAPGGEAVSGGLEVSRAAIVVFSALLVGVLGARLRRAQVSAAAQAEAAEERAAESRARMLAAEESEDRFRSLAESMPHLSFVFRQDGGAEYLNERFTVYTGLDAPAADHAGWPGFIHPDELPLARSRWADAVARGASRDLELRLRSRDGSYRWFLVTVAPLAQDAGRGARWIGTAIDIDERKRAERELAQAKQRLEVVMANLPVGVFIADAKGELVDINENGRAIWAGAPPARTTGEYARYHGFWPGTGEPLSGDDWALARAVSRGETVVAQAVDIERFDGTRATILDSAAPMRDAEGRITGGVAVIVDITDRRRMEEALRAANEQLQEADRRKNEFLAVLSHELRNPLTPIRNGVYILERAAPGSDQARRARAVIDRQAQHMTRLIDDLLDVTRISRGKIELHRERVALGALAARVADDYRDVFARGGVELALEADGEELWVDGDPTRLAQAVGNLLQNSAKFTHRGGRTTLAVARRGDVAVIRVRDDGDGITPDVLAGIFDPFVQADRTLARSRGGLGLGLALVKSLVEMHGGAVEAHSDGAGKGAEFVLTLPLTSRAAAPAVATARPALHRERRRRVLVVEDNVDAAESLREALVIEGHEVAVAYSGPQGLEAARAFHPEVVFCDLGLPGLDGFDVARAMRADPTLRSTYLVALSGYALQEDIARAEAAGFDRHVAKPPSLEDLSALLREAPAGGSAGGQRAATASPHA